MKRQVTVATGAAEKQSTDSNKSVKDEAARVLAEVEKAEKRAEETEKNCKNDEDDDYDL
jgi:hypothetical protein